MFGFAALLVATSLFAAAGGAAPGGHGRAAPAARVVPEARTVPAARRVSEARAVPAARVAPAAHSVPALRLAPAARSRLAAPLPTAAELRALVREVDRRHGGRTQVAVTRGGRVVAAASSGPATRPFRLWSIGKVATAAALLERGGTLKPDVRKALGDALAGSSNCGQRQLMVELQRRAGGIEPARRALARVLRRAGVRHANLAVGAASNRSGCRRYLAGASTPGVTGPALQLGAATWRLSDAARFAFALGDFPKPIPSLLQRPKRHSGDDGVGTSDVTGDLGWGAGVALGDLRPAYKAGWGGLGGALIYEQVIHAGGHGIAVTFEPRAQPAHDDPYRTRTPQALASLLRALRPLLGLR